jgi:HYR domain/Secretion system C-terminal sorting domain
MKKIWLLFIFIFGFGLCHLYSQAYLDLIHSPDQNTTLQDIQVLAEVYFTNRDKARGSGYKQYKRWEYKMERQVNADGKLQNFSKLTWEVIEELNSTNPPVERSVASWTSLGPSNYTNGANGYNGGLGRVNVIAFHPTNANIIYIGMPAGGVWKTTDGGTTWSPMADILASIGVSGIAVDQGTPNTIYILTGDGDAAHTYSIGVMKSTDGGVTWGTTGLSWNVSSFNRGYKLLMHPTNSSIMFAVTTAGILKTTDGWATWSTVQAGSFRDIEFKPGTPATMYATTTNAFYRSIDTGSSWGAIGTGLPANENRAAIAVTPANSNYVYYLAGPGGIGGNGTYNGMYRSTNSGVSFSTMSTTPNILGNDINGGGTSDQSWYDLAIAVNPSNANNTIIGGVNVWRSTNGGVANTLIAYWFSPGASQYVHADIHDLVYNPVDGVLYCGSDGGISKSTDDGVTWTNIWSGLQIMQFYRIAGVETNQNLLYGGTQDNGTNKYTGSTTILHILGGDGMDCMIDYNNNNNVYYSFQNGGLQRSTNGGTSSTGIQPSGSTGAWVTPYGMDATNPSIIYGGYSDVYRSTNMGTSWSNLGSDGRGAFAVGINDGSRLYAAFGSAIQTSANTGGSWTTITGSWPALTITFIAVDPANANRVWITLGGYTAGQKVYESTNAGSSWTNISGALPNTPALSIAYENTGGTPMDAIYVGMGVGVYYRSDVTAWTLHDTGLPNVPIYDLQINHTNSKIRAGTFGRGLWETLLFGAPTCDVLSTNVTSTQPSCPGVNDGSITITATCTTCTNIRYIITPTAPPGAPISQVGNGVFSNLSPNSYDVAVEDSADSSCTDSWPSNPVVIPAGMDNTAPAITCPANLSVECGGDTSPASTGTATATDNCDSSPNITFSDSSASNCGNSEVITRTWTATDASGNSSNCMQTITVVDTTAPTVSCPANVSIECGGDTSPASTGTATGADGCGSVTITFTDSSAAGCGNTEVITRTWTSTDQCGNSTNCDQTITVIDTTSPSITCPANITIECGDDTSPANTGTATGSDGCGTVSFTFSDVSVSGCGNTEVITRTWTATDQCTNTATCVQIITVVDTNDPMITCPANITVNNDAGVCEAVVNYTAPSVSDNCGGVTASQTAGLASGSSFPVGTTTNTFEVTDACGNTATCSFDVTVNDVEDPTITCPADQTVMTGAGNMYVVPDYIGTGAATVTDNCTDPVVITTQSPTGGTQLPVGVYTVTLTAEDDSSNIGNCTFELTVELPLGMNDNSGLGTLLLYPNPGTDHVILSNPENLELDDLSIYDISGRLIKTLKLYEMGTEISIDISELQSTIYLVLIRGTQGQITKQLLKK